MMKRRAFNCSLSLLLSVALLVTSVCATVSATALSALEDAPFTAYYSSNMQDAADGKANLDKVSLSTDWKLNNDGTMLVRKDKGSKGWNQDVVKNMSVLYYNVKKYKNFDMTVTYKTSADRDDWVAFFGFGGEMGKSWLANSSDSAFIIHEGGLLLNAKNKNWYSGDAVCGRVSNWVNGSVHTLRLKVFQGGFTVWIDGCQLTSGSNEDYTDGYIWFAANATDVAFGVPEVTELVDTSVFSAYFSSNMSTREEVSPASLGTQWHLNDTNERLQRNLDFNGDESYNDWGSGTAQNMSVLYYNVKSYKRFDMTVDYRTIENIGDQIAFAGFGAKIGKSWNYNASDNAFVLRADGSIANAKNNSVITASGMTAQDQTIASGKQWSAGGVHKLRILVDGDKYTVWIDGFEVASNELKNYDGGYIYFAANAGTVQFSVPTVTEFIDEASFTAYYSSDIAVNDPTESDFSRHWNKTSDKTMLERNSTDTGSDITKNNAILYYGDKDYENFVIKTDYSLKSGKQLIFGFGAEIGKSYKSNAGDNALAVNSDGGITDLKTGNAVKSSATAKALATAKGLTWASEAVHTLGITSSETEFFITVDGYAVAEFKNEDYDGGYIWFAANSDGVKLAMPGITSDDKERTPFDSSAFSSYFTSSVKNQNPTSADFSKYWDISKNKAMAVRKAADTSLDTDYDSDMAILYLNTSKYKNFDMTVEFKTLANYNDWVTFFGFGAEMGKSWTANSSDTAFIYHAGGLLLNAKNGDWYPGTAVSDTVNKAGQKWIASGVHTLRLMVYEKSFTVWIDGYKLTSGSNRNYEGGYIWFASNGAGVQFGMPEITEVMDNSVYDAYYCENLTTDTDMSSAVMGDWWSISDDGERLVRSFNYKGDEHYNDWGGKNNYITSLWYNASSYTDFIMTVDYKMSATNCMHAFVGFGGEKAKSWKNSTQDVTLGISADGSLMNVEDEDWLASGDKTAASQTAAAGDTWNSTGVHTLKIRVSGNTYTVWIDGYKVGDRTAENYTGGYIYFAASAGGVEFGTPEITVPIKETVFSAYYSEDITEKDATAEDFSEHWTVAEDGKRVERKGGDDALDVNVKNSMGILYYNTRKYTNFDMTVEFSTLEKMEDWAAFFGFGASEMGKSWQTDAAQTVFTIHSAGLLLNTKVKDGWYDATAASGAAAADGKTWKRDGLHTLRLKVEDCYCEVWIDGYPVGETGNWDYRGGYIYFAANMGGVTWGVPEITSLDEEEGEKDPNYVDYTWEPTAEDAAFDFSVRRSPKLSVYDYVPLDAEKKK